MDFLKRWEIFDEPKFIRIIQTDEINEIVKPEDPIGFKSEVLPTPPNSAYHNLHPSRFPTRYNYMSQPKNLARSSKDPDSINFYELYFFRDVKPARTIEINDYYCDSLGDKKIELYEFIDSWHEAAKIAISKDSTSDLYKPATDHVVFEFTGHARIRQWRHGFIIDRLQDPDANLTPIQNQEYNERTEPDPDPIFTYLNGNKPIPAPRIPTHVIVEASKKIFAESIASFNKQLLKYKTTYYGEMSYLDRTMYVIFRLELELYDTKDLYVFVIESVIWHPKGHPPGSLPQISL